jgi:hypothetical protein
MSAQPSVAGHARVTPWWGAPVFRCMLALAIAALMLATAHGQSLLPRLLDPVFVVDLVIAIMLVEWVVLAARRRLTGGGLGYPQIAALALSGLGLIIALRAALLGMGALWVLAGLCIGGLGHAADITLRIRRA